MSKSRIIPSISELDSFPCSIHHANTSPIREEDPVQTPASRCHSATVWGVVCLLFVCLYTNHASAADLPGRVSTTAPTFLHNENRQLSLDANGNVRVTQGTLEACEDQTNSLCMVSGGVVRSKAMAAAVTTDTTSAAVTLPVGSKSIYGSVAGTGSVTQTQKIYGGITSGVTATTGVLLCTLTLSGTTTAVDACPVITANFLYYIVVTSATTGTSASGDVTAMY